MNKFEKKKIEQINKKTVFELCLFLNEQFENYCRRHYFATINKAEIILAFQILLNSILER